MFLAYLKYDSLFFPKNSNLHFLGSGPEGVNDLCIYMGIFSFFSFSFFSSSFSVPPSQIPVLRPKFQSQGPYPSFEAQILA